jgi:hypothetical protein
MKNDVQVANTILQQLGGAQFAALTGAKQFVAGDMFLQFSIPTSNDGINKVRITLDPRDTYTVEFWAIRKAWFKQISSHSDVYCDMLQDVFEHATGLYVTLFPRR